MMSGVGKDDGRRRRTSRKSRASKVDDSKLTNCQVCDKSESFDDMCQCDTCSTWWHYGCAGVGASIEDRDWECRNCILRKKAPSVNSKISVSSRADSLRRMRERQELELQRVALDMRQRFLDEQDALMKETSSNRREHGKQRTAEWVAHVDPIAGAVGGEPAHPTAADAAALRDGMSQCFVAMQRQIQQCANEHQPTQAQLMSLRNQLQQCEELFSTLTTGGTNDVLPVGAQPGSERRQLALPAASSNMAAKQTGQHALTSLTGIVPKRKSVTIEAPELEESIGPLEMVQQSVSSFADVPPKIAYQPSARTIAQPLPSQPGVPQQFMHEQLTHPLPNLVPHAKQHNFVPTIPSLPPLTSLPITTCQPTQIHQTSQSNEHVLPQSIPRSDGTRVQCIPRNDFGAPTSLTPQQLAARQSFSRDLPHFSGDPAEWPIFIANYDYTTAVCGFSNGENMLRLQRCLKGQALEVVRSSLVLPATIPHVIETLRLRYGRPDLLINNLLQKVRAIPVHRVDKLEGLMEFGTAVQALCHHIEAANEYDQLCNPQLLQELIAKLPDDQKLQWATYRRNLSVVNLKIFGDYMAGIVRDAASVIPFKPEQHKTANREKPSKSRGFVNSHNSSPEQHDPGKNKVEAQAEKQKNSEVLECVCCGKNGHRVRDCYKFKALSVSERWKLIRERHLCFSCLCNHGRRPCRSGIKCDIVGCKYRHNPLLHSSPEKSSTETAENHTHRFQDSGTLFRIVPVTVYGKSGTVDTFAFLDEGSDLTLVEDGLAKQLGLGGSLQPLCLRWTGNASRVEHDSRIVSFEISGPDKEKRYILSNARTVGCLNLTKQSFQAEAAALKYKYLRGVPLASYSNAEPQILIGIDNLRLAVPLKTREGDGSGPIATKTRLGWCVYGRRSGSSSTSFNFHSCKCEADESLNILVKQMFIIDDVGAAISKPQTEEDNRALAILEKTTKRVGDRFETGLLWAQDDVVLPDSYGMAKRRLECLERRMYRDERLKENLHKQVLEYVAKGYAHKATPKELQTADRNRIWYLPLGAVINPKKPEKVRVIWDAAAKVDGVSLNSQLLKGPDQLSSLLGVLFQFRLYRIAVSSDIKEMFHQIQIRPADKNSQRFLWRSDPSQKPDIYLMDVATFGATCSPASAQYVQKLNAKQHEKQFPKAARSISTRTYVDDYFESFGDEEEAKSVAADLRTVQRNGGFILHNWRSNSTAVLEHLGVAENNEDKTLNWITEEKVARVLGMLWRPSTDELGFSTQMSVEVRELLRTESRPTKRQILRCVMTLFDPLGLLAPFLIHGKVLIQDLWRAGSGWDEAVNDAVFERWLEWTRMIDFIDNVRLARCYFSDARVETYKNAEIHIFVDASEVAYSCAAYIRIIRPDGTAECQLVSGKAKVAPLKPMSIPRLELQSCVLGTRLLIFILQHIGIPITRYVLWTDSRTAQSWINADPRNYRPFVAHRIGEILEHTTAADWRWVPSKLNPADEATKWGCGPYFKEDALWFSGPEFLRLSEENWPGSSTNVQTTDEEKRATVLIHRVHQPVIDFSPFSKWERLYRTVAYILRLSRRFYKSSESLEILEQPELTAAMETIYKQVQLEVYPGEIAALQRGENVPEKSPIRRLVPFLDENGVLRENSRIRESKSAPYDVRFPVILPQKHRVTMLIVDYYHRRYNHANSETVVNEVRQLYSISGLRTFTRRISRSCMTCRIRKAKPSIPPMAPLPPARLAERERPFTYTGLDYFGPLLVKIGRSNVKRWIAVFTCMTVRAVHFEAVSSLSTSSCILAVRRFVGRRGAPAIFFSDNGTNFVGASRILQQQINQGLSNTFTNADTKWKFNPPGAPHMGGVWERLVRSVKVAIEDGYSEGKLDDEGLNTLIVEAESIINSRPLTYLPLDSAEFEALTPNHFLLGSSNGIKQPAVPIAKQRNLRETWGLIQRELDTFWRRWTKEYLPILRRQDKWFQDAEPVEVGSLVLIADPRTRNGWVRGRVVEIFVGSDGQARTAVVETANGVLKRAVHYLARLDVSSGNGQNSAVSGTAEMHPGEDVGTTGSIGKVSLVDVQQFPDLTNLIPPFRTHSIYRQSILCHIASLCFVKLIPFRYQSISTALEK
ncbi:uncharacterized protein LOC129752608 [Uranotaenia lowii]|uniref:uncharacterized protein LOC129752608 n=1 Tax=Uranotaenia lowii TaxID=190385 RepID=UPI00247944BB|nr:uncharacterized protein LOC129752608 [Uranotaenia lowii]